jgi:hypothetical protein
MKLVLEKLLIWKLCLILGDQRRRQRTAERIFDNFILFAGAQEYADRRLFVRFAHIAVKGFQIKVQLMQSIFSVAARRRKVLADTANAERRAGALKMDWTEPLHDACPMCIE